MINFPAVYSIRRWQLPTIVAGVLLLPGAVFGQQSVAPGAASLEAEALAEVRRYAVELIVFEFLDSATAGTELFLPETYPEPFTENDFARTDSEDYDPGTAIHTANGELRDDTIPGGQVLDPEAEVPRIEQADLRLLPRTEYVLNDVYRHLRRLDAYRPVMHTAWTQRTVEKEDTPTIDLKLLGNPPPGLSGTFSLYLSRFLHLVVDLSLEEKSPAQVSAPDERRRVNESSRPAFRFGRESVTPSVYYRIEEDRIVRNGELRYYDHPRFGVIAKISRVEGAHESGNQDTPGSHR